MIAACCIFYKQKPELLDRMLCSLVGRVDIVCLLDGPYRGLSDELQSPDDNYDAIARYQHLHKMLLGRPKFWKSEAAKRTACADLAKAYFRKVSRVLVIDSDEALLDDIPPFAGYAAIYQDGTPTSRMRRVYPLTPSLRWERNHAHVLDDDRTYWNIDFHTSPTSPWQFRLLHTPADKRIQAEYDTYNATIRPQLEAQ